MKHPTPSQERLLHLADDVDDAWDDDDADVDDMDIDDGGFDDAAFDDLAGSDWPRAAVDACAPEGAFDAR